MDYVYNDLDQLIQATYPNKPSSIGSFDNPRATVNYNPNVFGQSTMISEDGGDVFLTNASSSDSCRW